MARCQITGASPKTGKTISRRGKAKREGGVGKKTTGISFRSFKPNLQKQRIWVPELDRFVTVRCTAKAIKTMDKRGAYGVLLAAGLVKPPKSKKKS
ncbi:MAG: 50S ribosomal protein L28 [Planctomycetes bacterium]|nr:50S ribosomal protein L28 [Planctomycetota bacterium]